MNSFAKTRKHSLKPPRPPKIIQLHLGCGRRQLPGFIHVDLASFPHIDRRQDIRTLAEFKNDSVDLIYCAHALEYFDRLEVKDVLKEWRRVLKKGGVLRLAVPDFQALVRVYQKYKKLESVLGPLYGRWPMTANKKNIYHKTVYDFASLKALLQAEGFRSIRRWDWKKVFSGKMSGFDDYSQAYVPHLDKRNGILISLNVEAMK